MSRGTCAKRGKKACYTWKKYILVYFIPSVQDIGQKSSNERFWLSCQSFFLPLLRQQSCFFFSSGSEQRTDRVERFPVTFSMPLLRLPLLRHKDHESVQFVRASRGVNSIKTSLQNRTRISCIIYLLYPSSKTREKNTCQLFAYKTYLNMKGRFIYF